MQRVLPVAIALTTTGHVFADNTNLSPGSTAILSGDNNLISEDNTHSTISGGAYNRMTGSWASISGGGQNNAVSNFASITGGYNNVASGRFATVLGGSNNRANGRWSLVAGKHGVAGADLTAVLAFSGERCVAEESGTVAVCATQVNLYADVDITGTFTVGGLPVSAGGGGSSISSDLQEQILERLEQLGDASVVEVLASAASTKADAASIEVISEGVTEFDVDDAQERLDALEEVFSPSDFGVSAVEHTSDGMLMPIFNSCPTAKLKLEQSGFFGDDALVFLVDGDGHRPAKCDFTANPAEEAPATAASCKAILDFRTSRGRETVSGVYTISPGDGHEYDVWCDMDHDGGGWTVCYNHNLQDLEEMDHSTTERMTTVGGTPGEESEYYANCAGIGAALEPAATRICTKGCQNWIELVNAPMTFHRDFWRCDGTSAVPITVRTWTSGDTTYSRSYNHHDCPGNDQHGGNAINQIANGGNSALCFEHNSRHQSLDSNHHWAVWGSCDGTYVQANNNNDRIGWARIMYR